MKINVVFDMQDEGDRYDFNTFVHMHELTDIKDQLYALQRTLRKYDERKTIPTDEVVEKLRDILCIYTGDE